MSLKFLNLKQLGIVPVRKMFVEEFLNYLWHLLIQFTFNSNLTAVSQNKLHSVFFNMIESTLTVRFNITTDVFIYILNIISTYI